MTDQNLTKIGSRKRSIEAGDIAEQTDSLNSVNTKTENGLLVYECRDESGMRHGVSERGHVLEGRKRIERFYFSRLIAMSSWSDFCKLRDKLVSEKLEREREGQRQREIAKEKERKRHPIRAAYYGSDATFTRMVLKRLEQSGYEGQVGALLFRIQKASSRAKSYRGDYKGYAYGRKGDSLKALCSLLERGNMSWGWKRDKENEFCPEHVLYVDLPNGQVSFHSPERFSGPDYAGEWDREYASEERIVQFGDEVVRRAEFHAHSHAPQSLDLPSPK